MAYHKPADIDGYVTQMAKADMRVKAQLAEDLVLYLSDSENSIECTDLGLLIDGLIPWMTGSHHKIAQRALEAFTELIVRLGQDFNAYTSTILPHVIDRLGDSRDTVREKAQLLLHKLMECRVVAPQSLLDKLSICFKHKNAKVREEFLQTIVSTLNEYGTQSLSVKMYIAPIVSLLGDPAPTVRDAAIQTLVEIYKHVGDKLRVDLKKREVPPTKAAILEQKFDETRNDGLLLPSALQAAGTGGSAGGHDELDRAAVVERPTRLVKRTPSATTRKPLFETPSATGSGDLLLAAGAVSQEVFEASFENVPQLTIFSQRDMDEHMKTINTLIGDKNVDWEKRVDALKKIRSLLMINVQGSPAFVQQLKDLSIAFLDILKELRSQVIREACITLAYMSKVLRSRLDQFAIYILQELINLIQNSAKVISSAGTLALKYVIRYTHAPKIIPILTQNLMLSKSKDIRSSLCEMLGLLFEEWPTKTLEKHSSLLREALRKGMVDADNDARRHSRCAFWSFRRHFPDLADNLYGSLDISTQRTLERERDNLGTNGTNSMSVSLRGSNSSLNSVSGGVIKRRQSSGLRSPATAQPPVSATSVSTENLTTVPGSASSSSSSSAGSTRLQRAPSLPRTYNRNRSGIPVATTPRDANPPNQLQQNQQHQQLLPAVRAGAAGGFRSVSAVDTAAAQRARARAQYSTMARLKVTSGTASLQGHYAQQARAKKTPTSASATSSSNTATSQQPPTAERKIRSRAGVSQSQPTSRSTSPSSKLRDMYGGVTSLYRQTGTVPKKAQSGIPRSLANSRETSPTRSHTQFGSLRRPAYGTSSPRRPPLNPGRPVLAQKILQQSREAENALADALTPSDEHDNPCGDFARLALHRKISRDESDESEASSVCSERSYDSYRRGNDSFSWNGSRTRLDSSRQVIDDIETIIQFCASSHWSERKDGLINLTQYLSEGKMLTQQQLQCVLDLFRKMFMDPHIKVYALFLDTVNELILSHSNDLQDWLFILLTRLFNKLGTDLLGSMHGKIWKTLQLIYEYFPADLQLQCVFRILVDSVQTPNLKTRQATLKFLSQLATSYCTASQFVVHPQNQQVVNSAIQKIIQTSLDQKSIELKSQARMCIVALYNCNPSQMTMTLANLPKQYQDTAKVYIQQNIRRSVSGNDSPSSPLSSSSPKPLLSPQQGPYSLQNIASPRSRQTSVEAAPESMNTEEVYKNLRKTTAEIQNYSFESKLDRDANSKDSGISQMGETHMMQSMTVLDAVIGHGVYGIPSNGMNGHVGGGIGGMEKDDSCNGSKTQSATTTESNTPENTVRLDGMDLAHKTIAQQQQMLQQQQQQRHQSYSFAENGELLLEKGVKENDVIKAAIVLTLQSAPETTKQVLENLQICIKHGSCELPIKNFKAIMKMLLHLMESSNNEVLTASLQTLGRIVRSAEMKACWSNFLELILLKIIDCYKICKEVSREIDIIVVKIAGVLPLDISVNILNPVIATGEFPANLCALKILTELTQKQGKDLTDNHLDCIMPNVARLADDSQSMVRKAAVFCIVKLYIVMGEEKVKPKFSLLNASKIRLLNVYIAKSLGGGSGGSSSKSGSSTTALS